MSTTQTASEFCACGCGREIIPVDKRGRLRRYAVGHGRRRRKNPGIEVLSRLYLEEMLSPQSIADRLDAGVATVHNWLMESGIPLRNIKRAHRVAADRRKRFPGSEILTEMYVARKMSSAQIGAELGVCANTIRLWLDQSGIPRRTVAEAKRAFYGENRPSDEELRTLYIDQEMSAAEIAETFSVDPSSAWNWLRHAGIPRRSPQEAAAILARKRPPKEKLRKDLSPRARYLILERDGFRCCACGRSPKAHGVVLHVDHITPVAKGGTNDPSNLQSLCKECNEGKSDLAASTP